MKCPVCDYVIEKDRVDVKLGDKIVTVCCQECAEKLKKESKAQK